MNEYDIGKAFRRIENELIKSMIANLKHHKAEEEKEGILWSQWQVEQLAALEEYKKQNKDKFSKEFAEINGAIDSLIKMAREEGNMDQEEEILKAIKKGAKLKKGKGDVVSEFFKVNDRKLNALIKATEDDFKRGEIAILRRTNDQYRKIIFDAQVYANAGGTTYEKAVDMATKDFLSKGIDCIEYANGSRHSLADYADMAIKTAVKRAYLTGEGEKRKEWGVPTVIVNKRGNPCPKCLPFCGKILIDDVWSGGSSDGKSPETGKKYPLMSKAIEAGLYHPRCKDSHTTFFEGINSDPDDTYRRKELEQISKQYEAEQKQNYAKKQAEKFGRLGKYSLDRENRNRYKLKADEWEERKILLQKYKPTLSSVDWSEELGLNEKQSSLLNQIHSDLNQHMLSKATEKVAIFGVKQAEILSADIGEKINEVVLSKQTLQLLKKTEENSIILSHVHPDEVSFSRADIEKLIEYKSIKALTLECSNGSKYLLDRGNFKSGLFAYSKYDKAFRKSEIEAQALFIEFETNDIDELKKIWPEYVDERNKLLAEKLDMTYKKLENEQ